MTAPAVRSLEGRVAYVTGGARGIGRAIASSDSEASSSVMGAILLGYP